jgi:hypothetical protein
MTREHLPITATGPQRNRIEDKLSIDAAAMDKSELAARQLELEGVISRDVSIGITSGVRAF